MAAGEYTDWQWVPRGTAADFKGEKGGFGKAGDIITRILIFPWTFAPFGVVLKDGGSGGTPMPLFVANSSSTLMIATVPIIVKFGKHGIKSINGAFYIDAGVDNNVLVVGKAGGGI